jgi:O-antigen ligase
VSAVLALVACVCVFVWLRRREHEDRSVVSVYFVFGLVMLEAAIYPSPDTIPVGLFHPAVGSLSFRLVDVLIPVALLARVLGRGLPRRLEAATLWWLAFLFWLAVSAVQGLLAGNASGLVAFEAKAIIYLGVFALAAGVALEDYVVPGLFDRFVYATAGLAALLVFTDQANVRIDSGLPILPLQQLGQVGADAATLFGTVGILAATVGATRDRGRIGLLVASTPLLVAVAAAGQRAALLGLVLAVGVLVLCALLARRHIRTTPTEIALALCAATGVLLVPFVVSAAAGRAAPTVPLSQTLSSTLTSEEKSLSAESRAAQLREARGLIADRPVFGWGLGKTYSYYDPGPKQFVDTKLTHNIAVDLLVRCGVVGLALFLISLATLIAGGLRVWFARDVSAPVAGFALGVVASLAGLLGKGMVESLFEKYRLAVLMGLLAGALMTAAAARVRVARPALLDVVSTSAALES